MEFCPACKSELPKEADACPICNNELQNNEECKWVMIGAINDSISSDYAKETLQSNDIPVVIISESGFFGTAGLPLNPFYGTMEGMFEVSVPEESSKEATEILDMILGDSWIKKE